MDIVQWLSDYQFACALPPTLEKCELLVELLVYSPKLDQDRDWQATVGRVRQVTTVLKSTICHLRDGDVGQ